jgi:hypothetical protein
MLREFVLFLLVLLRRLRGWKVRRVLRLVGGVGGGFGLLLLVCLLVYDFKFWKERRRAVRKVYVIHDLQPQLYVHVSSIDW